jgi:hypothetical protein
MFTSDFMTFTEAAAKQAATIRDAITHTKRVVQEAQARNVREREENAKLASSVRAQQALGVAAPVTNEMQKKARKFRIDNGLPVLDFLDPAGSGATVHTKRTRDAPKRDEDEDFSQRQIMIGDSRLPPKNS